MRISRVVPACAGVGCFALLLGMGVATAQSGDMGATGAGSASAADKAFVKKALAGGMAEVELGKLAAEKGNSDDVKQFGQKMVVDHTKLGDQMKPIASQLGIQPPSSLPPAEMALETKLKALNGDAFDKAYLQAMVKDHRQDLMEFKKEASTGKSSAVKDAASQGASVVSEHLMMVQDLAKKHGAGGGSSSM